MKDFSNKKPRHSPICPRCNVNPKSVELILQARSLRRPNPGSFGTRARRLCESCAREAFTKMEEILDD